MQIYEATQKKRYIACTFLFMTTPAGLAINRCPNPDSTQTLHAYDVTCHFLYSSEMDAGREAGKATRCCQKAGKHKKPEPFKAV